MTATLRTTIVQEPSSATANITLATDGSVDLQAGSVSAPSLSTVADTNTGLFFPAADTVALVTGGTERLRLASSGQLGVAGANYGNSGDVLVSGGSAAAPSWAAPTAMTLLGTITTTSGTTLSLTGLTLTNYKHLYLAINGVSSTSATDDFSIVDGNSLSFAVLLDSGSATNVWNATAVINLQNGSIGVWGTSNPVGTHTVSTAAGAAGAGSAGTKLVFGKTSQSTASTSIGVSVQTAFDAGSVSVYGVA